MRRGILVVLAAAVVIGGGAFAVGTATGTRAAVAATATQPHALQLGSRGPRVGDLQRRLIALGYLPAHSADGVFGMRTWHAVVAFQGWQLLRRDGVVAAATRRALAAAVPPRPWVRLRRALELDLRRQVLLVVAGGRTVRAVHISSAGPGHFTPRGRFHVYRRELLSWSAPYQVWMPHALYFSGGFAVHGFASVPAYPASHGCVRMPLSEAPFVYASAPLRTPVVIR